jgi:hypothetical protein
MVITDILGIPVTHVERYCKKPWHFLLLALKKSLLNLMSQHSRILKTTSQGVDMNNGEK